MAAFLPLPFWRSWHLEAGEEESVISLIQNESGVSGGVRGNATCCLPVRRNLVQGLLSLSSAFFFFFSFHKSHSTALGCWYQEQDIYCRWSDDSADPSRSCRFQTRINIFGLLQSLQITQNSVMNLRNEASVTCQILLFMAGNTDKNSSWLSWSDCCEVPR